MHKEIVRAFAAPAMMALLTVAGPAHAQANAEPAAPPPLPDPFGERVVDMGNGVSVTMDIAFQQSRATAPCCWIFTGARGQRRAR